MRLPRRRPKNPSVAQLPPPPAPRIARLLLRHFQRTARDLPWRRTRDPYPIWVSEIMLQQTQVQTVIPFWTRWMRALPTVQALAEARIPTVLKLWEGLGYYARARNLRQAARIVVSRHSGRVPHTVPELLALPGIGRYTAGAICSIAFNQPAPILDGNVTRVLCRLHALRGNPKAAPLQRRLWALANTLVHAAADLATEPEPRCASLNQSLMELGALICTPRNPRCPRCPLRRGCRAHAADQADQFPTPQGRPAQQALGMQVFVVTWQGRVLVRRRPAHGLNAGLWEFLTAEPPGEPVSIGPLRTALELLPPEPAFRLRHTITCHRLEVAVHRVALTRRTAGWPEGYRWVPIAEFAALPLAGLHRKILHRIQAHPDRRLNYGAAREQR